MRRSARPRTPRRGEDRAAFTLIELFLVLLVLGVVVGLTVFRVDRSDPGARGLRSAVEAFLESSRSRARLQGEAVLVRLEPGPAEQDPLELVRYVWRPVLETGFEARYAARQGLQLQDPARLGPPGRVGTGLDLSAGGNVLLAGRGGLLDSPEGLVVEFDWLENEASSGRLLEWEGMLSLRKNRDRLSLVAWIGSREEERYQPVSLDSEDGALEPGVWQRIRCEIADGFLVLAVDGREVGRREVGEGRLAPGREAPLLGDPSGAVLGHADEFVVLARRREPGPEMEVDVRALFTPPEIFFDRFGRLDPGRHPEPVRVVLEEFGQEAGSFLVGRFGQEFDPEAQP